MSSSVPPSASRRSATSPLPSRSYQAIGSGGGQNQILNRTVDFGASDAPMDPAKLESGKLLQGILKLQEKIAGEQSGVGGVSRPDPKLLTAPSIRPPG